MLSERNWLIAVLEVLLNFLQEIVRSENGSNIWMFGVSLISWINIVELFSALWSPSLWCDKVFIEDFLGVHFNKTSVAIVSDTTSVHALTNHCLDGLPWDLALDIVWVWHLGDSSHVNGDLILRNKIIRIIEGIGNIPAEGLELLTLSKDGVEP